MTSYDMYIYMYIYIIKDPLRFLGCFQMISMFGIWAPDVLPGGNPAEPAQNNTADVESKGTLWSGKCPAVVVYKMRPSTKMCGKRIKSCVFNL